MQKEALAMGPGSVSSQGVGAGSGGRKRVLRCVWGLRMGAINCHLPQIDGRSKLRTNQLSTGPNGGTEKSEMILALALTTWLQKQKTIIKSPTSSLPLITFPIITASFWNWPSYIPGHTDRGSHIADHSALLAHRKHQKKPTTPRTTLGLRWLHRMNSAVLDTETSQSIWTSGFYLQYMRIVGKMGLPTTPS